MKLAIGIAAVAIIGYESVATVKRDKAADAKFTNDMKHLIDTIRMNDRVKFRRAMDAKDSAIAAKDTAIAAKDNGHSREGRENQASL